MKLFYIKYILLSLLLVFNFCKPTHVIASDLLSDNFNTFALDTDKWLVLNENSSVILDGNYLSILPVDEHRSVFLENKISLPASNDIKYTIRFKFKDFWYGGGFGLNDNQQPLRVLNGDITANDWTILVWTTSSNAFKIFSTDCLPDQSCMPGNNILYSVNYPDSYNWHTLTIEYKNQKYYIRLDDLPEKITTISTRPPNFIWLGNPMIHGVAATTKLDIDYLNVEDYEVLPTFPYLSQLDPAWGSKEYDSASQWAGAEKIGIGRWGCAITSTAMLLQKYGIKSPEGKPVDPDILNTWLKSQKDGYIGPGLLNWLAITRYAKESFLAGQSPTKLEYVRSYLSQTSPILPAILGLPGHFVVAYEEEESNWKINDPNNVAKTTLPKTSTVRSINRFIPSNTDLSYMMFVTSDHESSSLTNEAGEPIVVDWMDEYLADDTEGADGPHLKMAMIPKPTNGKYRLTISNPTISSELKVYLYDDLGESTFETFNLISDTSNIFDIDFSKESSGIRTTTSIDLTPPPVPTVISPINNAHVQSTGLTLDWGDVVDLSSPITYYYKSSWNGGSYGPISRGPDSYIDAPGTSDRTYLWQVQACDSAGNCSEWSSTHLVVDSAPPTADIIFPTPGPSNNYFEVEFSEQVDPVEATNSANYFLSNWPGAGGSGDLVGDANITYSLDSRTARVTFTNPGWYISSEQLWGIQNIYDLAGNILNISPYTEYSTPLTPPVLASASITTPNPTNTITQTWSWLSATDEGSGVTGYDTRTYSVTNADYLNDWLWLGNVLGTSTNLMEGQWQLMLRARDNAGNTSSTATSSTLLVDNTVPSTPLNLHFDNPSLACGGFTKNKLITIDWDDATDNNVVAGYEYNIDYPLGDKRGSWNTFFSTSSYRGSLNEGTHYIKLRTKDTAQNYSEWSNSCSITYDSLIPTLKDQSLFDGWYTTPQISYFDFKDANLPNDYLAPSCEISSEGVSQTCSVSPNVCDKAGNCFTTLLTSNLVKLDMTRPTVTLNAWGSTINGVAKDTLSGLDKVEVMITRPDTSVVTVTATGTTNWTYTLDESPYGKYKVAITSFDIAGNTSEITTKEFDMSPPSSSSTNQNNTNVLGDTAISESKVVIKNPKNLRADINDVTSDKVTLESPTNTYKKDDEKTHGTVLGQSATSKRNYWWWILLILPIGFAIALKKRTR